MKYVYSTEVIEQDIEMYQKMNEIGNKGQRIVSVIHLDEVRPAKIWLLIETAIQP